MLQAILKHPVFKQGIKTDCDVLKAADACCERVRSLLLNTWPCQEGNTTDGTLCRVAAAPLEGGAGHVSDDS